MNTTEVAALSKGVSGIRGEKLYLYSTTVLMLKVLSDSLEIFAQILVGHSIGHLGEIFVEELQDSPDNVERNKPTQRGLSAITYKSGVTQTELAK